MEDTTRPLPTRPEPYWNARRRGWVYGVLGAVTPLLVTLGILTEGIAAHVMLIGAAVLAIGPSALALRNLSD